jgi:hypothetical protein
LKKEVLSREQRAEIKNISLFTLILLIISFLVLFYKILAYNMIRSDIELFDELSIGTGVGNFIKFIMLISFGILLSRVFKYNIKVSWITNFTLITGIVTFLCMYTDWAALHDIFQREPDLSLEWSFLRIGLIINLIFHIAGFITITGIRREAKSTDKVLFNGYYSISPFRN